MKKKTLEEISGKTTKQLEACFAPNFEITGKTLDDVRGLDWRVKGGTMRGYDPETGRKEWIVPLDEPPRSLKGVKAPAEVKKTKAPKVSTEKKVVKKKKTGI